MFKIWLKSNEFEGIKNALKECLHFRNLHMLELMMILMFLTGAAVLDDVLHDLHMP